MAHRPDQARSKAPGAGAAPRRLAWARLALVLGALVASWTVLEGAAWLVLRGTGPVRHRDGIYVSPLPLVNGRPGGRYAENAGDGAPLPEEKAPGELRIAVFGESSVVGAPWGYAGSPATMLHDVLRAAIPDRPLTVVNMGHTSSFVMDSFYYLLSVARYRPDYVVFYQGMNDRFDLDAEMCFPLTRPRAYAAWRWLVARSNLLFATRVLGPERLGLLHSTGGEANSALLCHEDTLGLWTDLLVSQARETGAKVVVVTPVASVLDGIEHTTQRKSPEQTLGEGLAATRGAYRALLACVATPECDLPRLAAELGLGDEPSLTELLACPLEPGCRSRERLERFLLPRSMVRIAHRGALWRSSAERGGGTVVEFFEALRAAVPEGLLGPPMVLDEVHLSLAGYALWAQLVGQHLLALEAGEAVPLPALDLARYRRALSGAERLLLIELALSKLESRKFLISAGLLRSALEAEGEGAPLAAEALGWMREALQIEPPEAEPPEAGPPEAGPPEAGPEQTPPRELDVNALKRRARHDKQRVLGEISPG